jgi:hypothetical protein
MNTGYGSFLTKIVKFSDELLLKYSISNYGNFRIEKEITFYKNIIINNIQFPMPKIYNNTNNSNNSFYIEYLKDYITCEEYLKNNKNNQNNIINIINNNLIKLQEKSIIVSLDVFEEDLKLETYKKIYSRINEIDDIIKKYSFIESVNNFKILDIHSIVNFIERYVNNFINSYKSSDNNYVYYPVHGDIQLNNILINDKNLDIKYIDPRGFFGNTIFYGMKEYDYAKLYFGLGGYSYFDIKNVTTLDISDNNINIDIDDNKHKEYDYHDINITNIFIICIWLGNAHCFKTNENKLIESYFYALYIASKFIKLNYTQI